MLSNKRVLVNGCSFSRGKIAWPYHLQEKLNELYDEFLEKGFIQCNTVNAESYSRKNQVKQLAEIIKEISSQKKQYNLPAC